MVAAKQQVASLQAEVSALYSNDPRDPRPKSAKRKREPTAAEAALVGVEFEEGFIDWKVLAVEWSGEMEAVLV